MRTHRLAVSLALASLFSACNDHPVQPLDAVLTAVNRQENRLPAKTKIDFLFLIDNSSSMCDEQRALADSFDQFATFLAEDLGSSADYRLAVVSTDMGADNCDRGRFIAKPAMNSQGCDMPSGDGNAGCFRDGRPVDLPVVLKSGLGGNIGDASDLQTKFGCLVNIGTNGASIERGLEAIRTALSCDGPNRAHFEPCCAGDQYDPGCNPKALGMNEPEFLRPDALLVIVVVSDEDDCTDRASRALLECEVPETCGDATQTAAARMCRQTVLEGMSATDQVARSGMQSDLSECPYRAKDLVPVDEYVRFVQLLKGSPESQIVVATMVGPRGYTPSGQLLSFTNPANRPGADAACLDRAVVNNTDASPDVLIAAREAIRSDACCPDGVCAGTSFFSCLSGIGDASAGLRYLEFAEGFEKNGVGCPEPSTPSDAQLAACAGAPTDSACQYTADEETFGGKCRPVSGTPDHACTECVTICSDNFATPLAAIRDRVAKLVGSYCLDQVPACQVNDGGTVRRCETPDEFIPANYASQIRVEMSCTRTEAEGGVCETNIAPHRLAPTEWSLNLEATECGGGPRLALNDPPPAGAEVILEFVVAIGGGEAPAQNPAPAGDGGPMPSPMNAAGPDAGP